jgi:peptidoglycan/xylan/chitin deacetylase (PgdA/CDA1 family)
MKNHHGRFFEAVSHVLKKQGKRVAGLIAVWLERGFQAPIDGRFGILLYHCVAPQVRGLTGPSVNVPPQRFRDQLTGLMSRGYVIRPLREILLRRATGSAPPLRTVVVTFDDGFASVYAHAWPVLKELKAPATIFLNTAFLDSKEPFPFDHWGRSHCQRLPAEFYRPLSSAECREMAEDGLIDLGTHTHTHLGAHCTPEEFTLDTLTSVDILKSRFGINDVGFAFPGGRKHLGQARDALMRAVQKARVMCALTTEALPIDWRSDPFGWGRFNVYPWDTVDTLQAKLNGYYSWAPKLQEWLYSL